VAKERGVRPSTLVNEIAAATPDRTNLASTLRTFALSQAISRVQPLERERERLILAGSSEDLSRVLKACPLPSVLLDRDRTIRQLNRAFATWLNLDPRATLGQRLDNMMILRGPGLREMWAGLADGRLPRGRFTATYVSPGRVRTAQAIAVALAGSGGQPPAGQAVLFETLAGRP
jgi:PAS domain-containing protein